MMPRHGNSDDVTGDVITDRNFSPLTYPSMPFPRFPLQIGPLKPAKGSGIYVGYDVTGDVITDRDSSEAGNPTASDRLPTR